MRGAETVQHLADTIHDDLDLADNIATGNHGTAFVHSAQAADEDHLAAAKPVRQGWWQGGCSPQRNALTLEPAPVDTLHRYRFDLDQHSRIGERWQRYGHDRR